jgi:hypothetical protein
LNINRTSAADDNSSLDAILQFTDISWSGICRHRCRCSGHESGYLLRHVIGMNSQKMHGQQGDIFHALS